MKKQIYKQIYKITATWMSVFAIIMMLGNVLHVSAQESTVDMQGLYAHPYTGIIEDSGGESSQALGQSMVDNMVSEVGTLGSDSSGQWYLEFTFSLMNSISEVEFQTQEQGEEAWVACAHEVVSEGEDITTFRIPVASESTIIRANCFVEPMGRAVVFFMIYGEQVGTTTSSTTSSSSTTTSANESESTALEGASGLIVSGVESSASTEQSEEEALEDVVTGASDELVLGNGFWMHAFMLMVSVNVLTILSAMLLYFSLKHIFGKKNEQKRRVKGTEDPRFDSVEEVEEGWDETVWEEMEGIIGEADER